MRIVTRALVACVAALATIGLDFAGSSPDTIVDSWKGDYVGVTHQVTNGVVDVAADLVKDVTLVCNETHAATFFVTLSGPWSKKNGLYAVKLDNAWAATTQAQLPSVAITKKKYRLLHIDVDGPALLGDTSIKTAINDGNTFVAVKEKGTFAMARQP